VDEVHGNVGPLPLFGFAANACGQRVLLTGFSGWGVWGQILRSFWTWFEDEGLAFTVRGRSLRTRGWLCHLQFEEAVWGRGDGFAFWGWQLKQLAIGFGDLKIHLM
jgi:hypothetical protein